ncbi:hypothetical protein [Parabacteroides pacaensis]|uniref:hypothetical protein n=1 Tax=Parabacteroides pacaensis TaxID=2086575 RepID=UPI00131CFF1F|nr:hypothetical protein [Parabacteroides pacaensis]
MKSFKNYLLLGIATLSLLMTSCLGDGNTKQQLVVYGYVDFDMDIMQTALRTEVGPFNIPQLVSNNDYLKQYVGAMVEVNQNQQTSNKYVNATLLNTPQVFTSNSDVYNHVDDIVIEPNEKPIEEIAIPSNGSYLPLLVINDNLLLATSHKDSTDQRNNLKIYFSNKDQVTTTNINGQDYNCYTLYVRSFQTTPGNGVVKNAYKYTAFDISSFVSEKRLVEKQKSKAAFVILVKYISKINSDGTFEYATPADYHKVIVDTRLESSDSTN